MTRKFQFTLYLPRIPVDKNNAQLQITLPSWQKPEIPKENAVRMAKSQAWIRNQGDAATNHNRTNTIDY